MFFLYWNYFHYGWLQAMIIHSTENITWARFLCLARSKLGLCSANHRPGYWSNLQYDRPIIAWAYSEQETENGPGTGGNAYGCIPGNTMDDKSTKVEVMAWCHVL